MNKKILAANLRFVTAGLMMLLSMQASAAQFDGKEWRQLTDTLVFTWDQIALGDQSTTVGDEGGVCPIGGGACSGSMGSTSFDGWTWATVEEVGSLFHSIDPAFPDNGITYYSPLQGSVLESVFFGPNGFIPTTPSDLLINVTKWAWGWSASTSDTLHGYAPIVFDCPAAQSYWCVDVAPPPSILTEDHYQTNDIIPLALAAQSDGGVWLYRTPPVPVPASLPMLVAGLLLTGAMRRRRTCKGGLTGPALICLRRTDGPSTVRGRRQSRWPACCRDSWTASIGTARRAGGCAG